MNRIYTLIIMGCLLLGCKEKTENKEIIKNKVELNQDLANELKKMVEIDQKAASYAFPPQEYYHLSQNEWELFKDSIFKTNQKRTKEIFEKYGFVGYDLAGKEGSTNFWIIVQHSDHDPEFQTKILDKMKIEVDKGNANPSNYGFLVDRIKLNTGKSQVYGTQVKFNLHTGQAYPKKLIDSINVNKRRKSIQLEPIETYLNRVSKTHFEMNKDLYINKGIIEPKLYKTE